MFAERQYYNKTNVHSQKNFMRGEKKKRKSRVISKEEIEKVMNLQQKDASSRLGCSVSTLKKRFREFFPDRRWPYRPFQDRRVEVQRYHSKGLDIRHSLAFICNQRNKNLSNEERQRFVLHALRLRQQQMGDCMEGFDFASAFPGFH